MTTTGLDSIRTKLTAAREKLGEWETERDAVKAELADLEQRAGAELVDAKNPSSAAEKTADQLSRLRGRVTLAEGAVAEAQGRLASVRKSAFHLAAEALEARAGELDAEREAHQAQVGELLDQLEQLDGVRYEPSAPPRDATRTEQLERQSQRLREQAAHWRRPGDLADDTPVERALAEADPEGPEAERAAEARRAKEQTEAQRRARATENARRRGQLNKARKQALGEVGVNIDGEVSREAFVQSYERALLAGRPHTRADVEQARRQAEAKADELEQGEDAARAKAASS